MANRTYLLNTPTRTSNIAALSGQWAIVAEACDCVPLAWLCMFDEADLRPCTITFNHSRFVDGERKNLLRKFSILNPSTTVDAAKTHLARARPVFETLAEDAETGKRQWLEAMAALERFPHEYLTIDPTELLLMDDLKAGATTFASAISSNPASIAAKQQIAGIESGGYTDESLSGLAGGFYSPGRFVRRERSAEDAKRHLDLLARLDHCNLAATGTGYEPLPLDLLSLDPPDAFWKDAELLDKGARHIAVSHGPCVFKDGKKQYATSLSNLSNRRIRVMMFGGFSRVEDRYVLTNYTRAWFTAKDFIDWYNVPADGWIQPGETATDNCNWGGNDDGFWAYWCKNEDGERFFALARFPRLPQDHGTQSSARDASGSWEPLLDEHRAGIANNIEVCRKLARDCSKREIGLDLAGVQWLDEFLDTLHRMEKTPDTDRLVSAFGAFLGECIIRAIGGEWAIHDGSLCVRQDEANAAFPLNKVRKHLDHGSKGGDSVLGFYRTVLAMKPKPLTARQQAFLSLYRARSDYRFFVPHKYDERQEWARVTKIDGLWVTIETAMTADFNHPPTVSLRLDQISDFLVTDAQGMKVDTLDSSGNAATSTDTAHRPTEPLPQDAAMERAIIRLRSVFADHRKFMNERSFESLRVTCPAWMKPSDPLHEIFKQQYPLHR